MLGWTGPDGKKHQETTEFRHGILAEHRKAIEYRNQRALRECREAPVRGEGWDWVMAWFKEKYRRPDQAKSLARYALAWRNLRVWLVDTEKVGSPRGVTRNLILAYPAWRVKPPDPLYRCSHNNALGELKVLGMIMNEAVSRGLATVNPCFRHGMEPDEKDEKPAITDEELKKIRRALKKKPEWMRVAFEIAMHTGCRLRETCIRFSDIDLERRTITFPAPKGGKKRAFTTRIHDGLLPLLERLKAKGRKTTCDLPPMPSKAWWLFFRKQKMKHLCFHCTRVTVITQLARARVPISQAMRFVNHASQTIHQVYQRLGVDDLDDSLRALDRYALPGNRGAQPSNATPR